MNYYDEMHGFCEPLPQRSKGHKQDFESKTNMYERQLDQLFEINYKLEEEIKEIKRLLETSDHNISGLYKRFDKLKMDEYKTCVRNYYEFTLKNNNQIENIETFNIQICIIIFIIIIMLLLHMFKLL